MRRILALGAAFGLAVSAGAFLDSLFGLTLDKMGEWPLVLHGGIFLLFLPMVATEYAGIRANVFFWTEFSRGKPHWVMFGIKAIFALFLVVFVLFLIFSRAASPQIRDGQYVLDNHGQIIQLLSETEYVTLREWELRVFASGWMCFYLPLVAYWWFPRSRALFFTQ